MNVIVSDTTFRVAGQDIKDEIEELLKMKENLITTVKWRLP